MSKIRLNEGQLRGVIVEAVKRFLNESYYNDFDNFTSSSTGNIQSPHNNQSVKEPAQSTFKFKCELGVWVGKGGFNPKNLMTALKRNGNFTDIGCFGNMVSADFVVNVNLNGLDSKFYSLDSDERDDDDSYDEFEGQVLNRVYTEAKKILKPIFGKTIKEFHDEGNIDLYGVECDEIEFYWGQIWPVME